MTQEQRAQFWLVLRALLDQMPDLGGPDVQPFYDAVDAELDKYTVITEPVAVPDGIAAVVRMAVECREGDGCSDDGDDEPELCANCWSALHGFDRLAEYSSEFESPSPSQRQRAREVACA